MNQRNTIERILRDMKTAGIIMSDKTMEARFFLNALWVAAYEEGLLEETPWMCRMIQQVSPEGKVVNVFESIKQASAITKYKINEITFSLEHGTKTAHNWYWKYFIEYEKKPRRNKPHTINGSDPYIRVVIESAAPEKAHKK